MVWSTVATSRPSFPQFSLNGLFSHSSGSRHRAIRPGRFVAPEATSRNRGPRKPFIPARRLFSHRGFPLAGIPDPWKLTPGQTVVERRRGCRRFQSVPWLCQTLFRIPAASEIYPNSICISKSFPCITCQTALASLQASALRATMELRCRFLRSYHAWILGS